jgi:hypothetical protein
MYAVSSTEIDFAPFEFISASEPLVSGQFQVPEPHELLHELLHSKAK